MFAFSATNLVTDKTSINIHIQAAYTYVYMFIDMCYKYVKV